MSEQDFPEDLWSLALQNEHNQAAETDGDAGGETGAGEVSAAAALRADEERAGGVNQAKAEPESDENIIKIDVSKEMKGSFLEYAYSVIYSRALPDARDGLKPVQRRILYMMHDMGLTPAKGHVKSSRVVGEVMGKLHPHGDSAIYEALVRLAQPFNLRLPQIDGHGNFGSLDDGPAAPRYTEARLAQSALDMVGNLDEDVVDFVPNYDNQFMQPAVLPAAYPNLLVNGSSGIAVGMATNIAPHNLAETVAGAIHLLKNPQASVEELMRFIPGPDFPGGGIVTDMDGVREAYETGKGAFKIRALASIERVTARKMGIVITELPYMVGPERVIEKIKEAVNKGKIKGISTVTNLTDKDHDLRLVIEVKNGFSPEAILSSLYRLTPLEESFNVTAIALVDGQPRTLSLKEILQVFCSHRLEIVQRRSRFRLDRRLARLHLVEGLLIAIVDIDEVIAIVRAAETVAEAKERLMKAFDLTEVQTEHILSLQLRRLTKFSRLELEAEQAQLLEEINHLQALLASEELRTQLVIKELQEVSARHATARRTLLLSQDSALEGKVPPAAADAINASLTPTPKRGTGLQALEIADVPCLVVLDANGKIARIPYDKIESLHSPTESPEIDILESADATKAEDAPQIGQENPTLSFVQTIARSATASLVGWQKTKTRSQLGAITNLGMLHKFSVLELPELVPSVSGIQMQGTIMLSELLELEKKEQVVAIVSLDENDGPWWMATQQGTVKRSRIEVPPTLDRFEVITLSAKDYVISAGHCPDDATIFLASDNAQLARFTANSVRAQGRLGKGMLGMKLKANAQVIAGKAVAETELKHYELLTVAQNSAGQQTSLKRSPLEIYPEKGRGGQGVRCQRFLKGETSLQTVRITPAPLALNLKGKALPLPELDPRRDGSGSQLPAIHTLT